jgi:hypothetical protein
MSTRCHDVCMRSPIMELSRVVVLASRPVEGSTVNELIENPTLLLKKYSWMARAISYRVVAWTRRPPMAE